MILSKLTNISTYLLIAVIFTFARCKDEPTTPSTPSTHFSPPAWIQGTWDFKGSDKPFYTFTQNDFVLRDGIEAMYRSQNDIINQQNDINPDAISVSVDKSDNEFYHFKVTALSSTSAIYQFKKISDTEMISENSSPQYHFTKRQ